MSRFIMGVDGGGTKSHLALFDSAGKCVGASACGPLNHESLPGSFSELEGVLKSFLSGALQKAGVGAEDIAHAVFGVAGVDTRAQHTLISDMLRRFGLSRFTLCNDSFLGVAAGCPGGAGICAINGTGSTMAAVDYGGAAVQICGVGEISNDCGGSAWYGGRTLGAVYGGIFKSERPTVLRELLFEQLGVTRGEDYMEAVTDWLQKGNRDTLNRLVFKAADKGDAVALDILRVSAEHYTGGIAYLARALDFPEGKTLYVTLAGSVFVKQTVKILPEMIRERVCAALSGRTVEFLSLDVAPVAGAVLWAAQKAGFGIGMADIRSGLDAARL